MFGYRFSSPPVPPNDSPFVAEALQGRLITTFWELGTGRSPKSANERTPGTNPPGCGNDDERVCVLEQKVVVNVIAVDNPRLSCKQSALLLEELVFWHPHPARFPTVEVEMDKGKTRFGR
jgi:hypothetical protein